MNAMLWTILIGFIFAVSVFALCWWALYDWMKKHGKKDDFLGRK